MEENREEEGMEIAKHYPPLALKTSGGKGFVSEQWIHV